MPSNSQCPENVIPTPCGEGLTPVQQRQNLLPINKPRFRQSTDKGYLSFTVSFMKTLM